MLSKTTKSVSLYRSHKELDQPCCIVDGMVEFVDDSPPRLMDLLLS
jgi:hypothetical protein